METTNKTTALTPFQEAARYAVSRIDSDEMNYALSVMDKHRSPLSMVGNSTHDEITELLNECGVQRSLPPFWFEEYGYQESALLIGYDSMHSV